MLRLRKGASLGLQLRWGWSGAAKMGDPLLCVPCATGNGRALCEALSGPLGHNQALADPSSLTCDTHPAPVSSDLGIPFLLALCYRHARVQLSCNLGLLAAFLAGLWTYVTCNFVSIPLPGLTLNLCYGKPCPWLSPARTPGCSPWVDHGPSAIPISGAADGLCPLTSLTLSMCCGTALLVVSACLCWGYPRLLARPPLCHTWGSDQWNNRVWAAVCCNQFWQGWQRFSFF